jgi:predicted ATPase
MSASASSHLAGSLHAAVSEVIHVPGLRTSPERTYSVAAVGISYPGTFDKYTATIIYQWVNEKNEKALAELTANMKLLALTSAVSAIRLNDAQIELQVGRLPNLPSKRQDYVNIADVGIGVSQALPVVTALLAARRGQLVYLEQPETHLHPRAQVAMAQVLAEAANQGVQVVAETHSSLLLLGVQALVAEGKLSPNLVKLHWFKRDGAGVTHIESADLDEAGAFGEWPEDFDDVELKSQSRYLDAAEVRRMKKRKGA